MRKFKKKELKKDGSVIVLELHSAKYSDNNDADKWN
jgi:hypothetical protein